MKLDKMSDVFHGKAFATKKKVEEKKDMEDNEQYEQEEQQEQQEQHNKKVSTSSRLEREYFGAGSDNFNPENKLKQYGLTSSSNSSNKGGLLNLGLGSSGLDINTKMQMFGFSNNEKNIKNNKTDQYLPKFKGVNMNKKLSNYGFKDTNMNADINKKLGQFGIGNKKANNKLPQFGINNSKKVAPFNFNKFNNNFDINKKLAQFGIGNKKINNKLNANNTFDINKKLGQFEIGNKKSPIIRKQMGQKSQKNNIMNNSGDILNMGMFNMDKKFKQFLPQGNNFNMMEKNAMSHIIRQPEMHGWNRIQKQKGLPIWGDYDGDKLPNILDCDPLDPNKQAFWHDLFSGAKNLVGIKEEPSMSTEPTYGIKTKYLTDPVIETAPGFTNFKTKTFTAEVEAEPTYIPQYDDTVPESANASIREKSGVSFSGAKTWLSNKISPKKEKAQLELIDPNQPDEQPKENITEKNKWWQITDAQKHKQAIIDAERAAEINFINMTPEQKQEYNLRELERQKKELELRREESQVQKIQQPQQINVEREKSETELAKIRTEEAKAKQAEINVRKAELEYKKTLRDSGGGYTNWGWGTTPGGREAAGGLSLGANTFSSPTQQFEHLLGTGGPGNDPIYSASKIAFYSSSPGATPGAYAAIVNELVGSVGNKKRSAYQSAMEVAKMAPPPAPVQIIPQPVQPIYAQPQPQQPIYAQPQPQIVQSQTAQPQYSSSRTPGTVAYKRGPYKKNRMRMEEDEKEYIEPESDMPERIAYKRGPYNKD